MAGGGMALSGQAHLERIHRRYTYKYNRARTHGSLSNDCPAHRPVQTTETIASRPILGGLHHVHARPK